MGRFTQAEEAEADSDKEDKGDEGEERDVIIFAPWRELQQYLYPLLGVSRSGEVVGEPVLGESSHMTMPKLHETEEGK